MMSENVMITPLFHQRSHSMPVGHPFINTNNGNNGNSNGGGKDNNNRVFDYKRSSPLKNDLNNSSSEVFPLPIPKSLASHQLHNNINNNKAFSSPSSSIESMNEQQLSENEPKFFRNPKNILNLFDYNRKLITNCPVIFNCKMDRGFFISQSHWTCYRRNYFQVTASFIIPGHSEGTCYALQLNSDQPMQPIQQFLLRLKACTSNNTTTEDNVLENHNMIRPVALTQMTPKRDKGPQREPPMLPITPSSTSSYNTEQQEVCVTFERLQFRVATANNGKRRASQQYFRLIFELVAQLQDNDKSEHVISECYSSPLVVRGRSPGHYSSEQQQLQHIQQVQQPPPPKKSTSNDGRKKRKLLNNSSNNVVNNNNNGQVLVTEEEGGKDAITTTITLPPPQYVFASPPMMIEQLTTTRDPQQHSTSSIVNNTTTTSSPYMMPMTATNTSYNNQPSSAFSNFHNRSQSANDSEFFSRHHHQHHRNQYYNNTNHGDFAAADASSYEVGMARALRNWQQQVVQHHQRTDSAATYDSFESNNNRASTRPGTPIPYHPHPHPHQSEVYHHHGHNGWSSTYNNNNDTMNNSNTTTNEKMNHRHDSNTTNELYNNNNNGSN